MLMYTSCGWFFDGCRALKHLQDHPVMAGPRHPAVPTRSAERSLGRGRVSGASQPARGNIAQHGDGRAFTSGFVSPSFWISPRGLAPTTPSVPLRALPGSAGFLLRGSNARLPDVQVGDGPNGRRRSARHVGVTRESMASPLRSCTSGSTRCDAASGVPGGEVLTRA